jgi:1-acyl-sn-glycerol-3-phosphate acyltransferase
MWAQRWPTIVFVGLYQIALDRCVEIEGLEHLPDSGPVILAGNHINKTAMDGMLLGSKILTTRGGLAKFVSIADHKDPILQRFLRLMGTAEGVILPIQKGMTTETMVHYLKNPTEFGREQSLLGIFPAGEADGDTERQLTKEWKTGAAVAACESGAPIVPFFIAGLPYEWGPADILKAVARSPMGKPFQFKIRFAAPIRVDPGPKTDEEYREITQRLRQSVRQLANLPLLADNFVNPA